ncbi:hypothetical protein [Pseudomonas taetrolens]|uniref:hypothetical protein n=1 Tax=Pseudomonas taetrolens TaxID=47884 RepID=UPI001E4FDEAE|nr:hypothetical protein [Pseudomonas taetrolens]
MAQHTQRAEGAHVFAGGIGISFIQLGGNTFKKVVIWVARVERAEFLPLFILGFFDKTQQVFGVQGQFTVVVFHFAEPPALGNEMLEHIVLEYQFVGLTTTQCTHAVTSLLVELA